MSPPSTSSVTMTRKKNGVRRTWSTQTMTDEDVQKTIGFTHTINRRVKNRVTQTHDNSDERRDPVRDNVASHGHGDSLVSSRGTIGL